MCLCVYISECLSIMHPRIRVSVFLTTCLHVCVCVWLSLCLCVDGFVVCVNMKKREETRESRRVPNWRHCSMLPLCQNMIMYGVATISRLLKIIGLFCRV